MSGVINGQEFAMATLNTSAHQEARSGVATVRSSISHIPASVGEWGPEPPLCPGPSSTRRTQDLPGARVLQGYRTAPKT